jgi:hypothetical protein
MRLSSWLTELAASAEEEEIRRMLGLWVSEIEPEIIRCAWDGMLIGLGFQGHVIFYARPRIVL